MIDKSAHSGMAPGDRSQVIVSGATGFIGRHLIPLLVEEGYRVIALGRRSPQAAGLNWYPHVEFRTIDLITQDFNFQPEKGSSLVHLAWAGLPDYKAMSHVEENLPASCRFIKRLVNAGVGNVLVTGTCLEYGLQEGALSPHTVPNPRTPYAIAKNTLRQYLECLQTTQEFSLKWARLFYMHGPGQNPRSILAQLDKAITNGDQIFRMSDGEQLRDYLPVQEVARQLLATLVSGGNMLTNICSGKPISIRRLVEEQIEERRSDIRIALGHYPYPDYEPMAFWGKKHEDKQ